MDENRILTSVLQLRASELDDAFLDGAHGIGLKEARASWLKFRQQNGFGSYANLLTLPSVQHKLKKSKVTGTITEIKPSTDGTTVRVKLDVNGTPRWTTWTAK